MAGDWIPISVELPNKPEVVRLAMALKCSTDEVVGLLVRFWSWAQAHTADGSLPYMDADTLAVATHIRKAFFVELQKVGWLLVADSGVSIPAFDRWFTGAAKRRLQERSWKRQLRQNGTHNPPKSTSTSCPQFVHNLSTNCPQNVHLESGQKVDHRREENIYTSSTTTTYIGDSPGETPETTPKDPPEQSDAGLRSDYERLAAYWPRGWPSQERDQLLLARLLAAQTMGKPWAKTILDSFREAVQTGPRPRNPGAYLQTLAVRLMPSDELVWFHGLAVPDWVHEPPRRKTASACAKPPPNGSPPRTAEEIAATRAMLQECLAVIQGRAVGVPDSRSPPDAAVPE